MNTVFCALASSFIIIVDVPLLIPFTVACYQQNQQFWGSVCRVMLQTYTHEPAWNISGSCGGHWCVWLAPLVDLYCNTANIWAKLISPQQLKRVAAANSFIRGHRGSQGVKGKGVSDLDLGFIGSHPGVNPCAYCVDSGSCWFPARPKLIQKNSFFQNPLMKASNGIHFHKHSAFNHNKITKYVAKCLVSGNYCVMNSAIMVMKSTWGVQVYVSLYLSIFCMTTVLPEVLGRSRDILRTFCPCPHVVGCLGFKEIAPRQASNSLLTVASWSLERMVETLRSRRAEAVTLSSWLPLHCRLPNEERRVCSLALIERS